jgi:hypothetical protein
VTADGLVNCTGGEGENYGESSANDSLLHPVAPARQLHDRRLRRAACRTGNDADADLRAPYWPEPRNGGSDAPGSEG